MMEKRELTCIGCPLGCSITVTLNGKEVTSVTGNTCSRGAIYAKKEVTDPTRIVTSSVSVTGGNETMVTVTHMQHKNIRRKRRRIDRVKCLMGV